MHTTYIFFILFSTLFALCAEVSANGHLQLEKPLDPIAGVFAGVAYWNDAETLPKAAIFQLRDKAGTLQWTSEGSFDSARFRAVAFCDSSDLPDGEYTLQVAASYEVQETRIRLRQGRVMLHDERPFRDRMLWMPMTGWTEAQLDDAVEAGYDTVFTKVAPWYTGPGQPLDFDHADKLILAAQNRGMKVVVAWLLWAGLPTDEFYLEHYNGTHAPGRIDPCWDEAMAEIRIYAEQLLHHYMGCADVIAIAPTWGIYGEAGYAHFDSGYSKHALRKFNQWRVARGEAQLDRLPDFAPSYDNLLFHRFRFEYLASVWGEFNRHIKRLEPNDIAIGAWQEIYNGHMFSLALSEAPGADFAVNEMCFPWGATYDQARAIGETMGIRYKCSNFEDYRDYYLPIIARRWAEGQQAIGCQLSNHYAEENYTGWGASKTEEVGFHQWEDRFAPYIRAVRDIKIIETPAEVAYVQMTYPASVYPDMGNTVTDINLYEIVLRTWGVAYDRIPITRLSRMQSADLSQYKLIVVPGAWYLDEAMWFTLKHSGANILLTGGVMQASDDGLYPTGASRILNDMCLTYGATPAGKPVSTEHAPAVIARDIDVLASERNVELPADLGLSHIENAETWVTISDTPLLTRKDNIFLLGNRLLFACAYDPERSIPKLSGSRDASADEGDPWGLASSSSPKNRWGETLLRNIIEYSGVQIRIPEPPERHFSYYLGDHVERVTVTNNIVVNHDAEIHAFRVWSHFAPAGWVSQEAESGGYWVEVEVPAYSYVALHP